MELLESHACFGGMQNVYRHAAGETGTDMDFAVFLPPQAHEKPESALVPAVLYLSGLTCTWENVITKAGAQKVCADLGLAFIAPDTSPRGTDLPGEHDEYDFGSGAGFYVDATQAPWDTHYRMESYITKDLPAVLGEHLPIDLNRVGITGHSMGGHGALTLALKNPGLYQSVSAFAPICAPMQCPWGEKALSRYLGEDRSAWRRYDACALIEDGASLPPVLVDQGTTDPFLDDQLKPALLEQACAAAGIPLTMRMQPGYNHSYYFIATFIDDHIQHHARALV